jgi:signal transduction histidine kinase
VSRAQTINWDDVVGARGAELRHEAHAALFGIEAAATGLTRHRLLTTELIDELATGLVAEVHRLRVLLEGRACQPATTFDLYEAIGPALSCARADGVEIRSSVCPGTEVVGRPDNTAQVLVSLLTNARSHAPGSPVDVRVMRSEGTVTLCVEDRGPGVPDTLQEKVFERSMKAVESDGSGLGLFIARRLMDDQDGTIAVRPRSGGGSSFELRFRAPASRGSEQQWQDEPTLVGA